MKPLFINCIFLLLLFTTCKKDHTDEYAGEFYIRIPLVENDQSYLYSQGAFTGLNMVYNHPDIKTLWKLVPAGDHSYFIVVAVGTPLFITDFEGFPASGLSLVPRDTAITAHQVFKIVKNQQDNSVYLQSGSSGKYIQLNYCFKGNETWGDNFITTADTGGCNAYAIVGSSSQADTCYCVTGFILERKWMKISP